LKGAIPGFSTLLCPIDGILARENLESPEPVKGLDNFLWFGRNRDGVRFKAGAWSVAGFELAVEDEGGEGGVSFLAG
jgi:hypothetical protein